jgi:V8-like Glu-specific endopeptidase
MGSTKWILSAMAVGLAFSAGAREGENARERERDAPERNTFLPDDRGEANLELPRYSKVVRVGHGCTGSLVWRNLVLTAAHCIDHLFQDVWNPATQVFEKRQVRSALVYSKYRAGLYRDYAYASKITLNPEYLRGIGNTNGVDWAILHLDKNLGDDVGYFDFLLDLPTQSAFNNFVNLAGYSSDRENGSILSTHEGCRVRWHEADDRVYHDCDMARGASGGSIFKCVPDLHETERCYVLAVNVAEYREGGETSLHVEDATYWQHRNVGVNARAWAPALTRLRLQYANGAPPPVTQTP